MKKPFLYITITTVLLEVSLLITQIQADSYMENMSKSNDCSSFSSMEQQFASQLSEENKLLFCGKFNQQQRMSAMEMAGDVDDDGTVMTQDRSVEKIAESNNMTMPSKPQRSKGGACPAH